MRVSGTSTNVCRVEKNNEQNTAAPDRARPMPALQLIGATLGIAMLLALGMLPFAGLGGAVVNSSANTMNANFADIETNKSLPQASTVLDREGNTIAWIYDQRRFDVPADKISTAMKESIVAIEDRRFYEHNGVDLRGSARALAANLSSGGVAEGASTLNQQYIKNYLWLISAKNDNERAAATETSLARKLREMKLAGDLDERFSKDEILTRYLNLISFGRGAYGVEAAARTYFDHSAEKLTDAEAALLAGVVQSTSALDPWDNPDAALTRRNQVLQARADNGSLTQAQADSAAAEPLGIAEKPAGEPNGCLAAGNDGFFCDYALKWLAEKGFDHEKIARGGYTITTTLDPAAQQHAVQSAQSNVAPGQPGVSEALSFIAPTEDSHEVVAMASSRKYGLDQEKHETVLPLPHSLQGHGAGSVFKIFAAAAAIEKGMGLETKLDVPPRVEVDGLGNGGASGCPPGKYCVENVGPYKPSMTLKEALATSPNTPFISMLQDVGLERTVNLAVKLGLRSYAKEGTSGDKSIAQRIKEEQTGSFVLGPTPVDPLELTNVGATLADQGRWCEPSPISSVTDASGKKVDIPRKDCEKVLNPAVANALANGMAGDVSNGTAADAARATGWSGPISAKTGTTETSNSAAFLGFTQNVAGSSYIFNDSGTASSLCTSPVRQCGSGNLYGGNEPARSFFTAAGPIANSYGGKKLPPVRQKQKKGTGELADGGAAAARR